MLCKTDVLRFTYIDFTVCLIDICPSGYLFHGAKCYKFVTSKHNWTDSKRLCEEEGANLVTVESQEEERFLKIQVIQSFQGEIIYS